MENLSEYINWFRHSSSYINAHRGRVFVILLPGEAIAHAGFSSIVHDMTLLHSLGVKLVLVHGARPQIDGALEDAGLKTQYHKGLRVTRAEAMPRLKQTVGAMGIELEAQFSMGLINSPMHGANVNTSRGNFITARPLGVIDGVDHGLTGVVRKVDAEAIERQLAHESIVMISNLGYSPTGEVFNLGAEEIATEVAIAMGAEKLILFIPEQGILDQGGEMISALTPQAARSLTPASSGDAQLNQGITASLRAATRACSNGVHRSHLIDYRRNGALIEELFMRDGCGTLVTRDSFEQLRPAGIDDVGGILELIAPMEEAGILVHRSRDLLEAEIDCFTVIEREGMVIACAALYPLDEHCGEIACIAIHGDYQDSGRGEHLLRSLEKEAKKQGLNQVIVLTTQTAHWFLEKGFEPIAVSELPVRKKQMYNYQRNSKAFRKIL